MDIETFQLERFQSLWERRVRVNLTESGVRSLEAGRLGGDLDLAAVPLGYPPTRGTPELRRRIADLYPGAGPENVLVGNGTAEAVFVVTWSLVEPGSEVALMLPNWLQAAGLARAFGGRVRPFRLRPRGGRWAPDLDGLDEAVTDRTRLVVISNPNNPTGATLTAREVERICEIAAARGAWILADEVYREAELGEEPTPGFWGAYERALVVSGLSKAYGLPGLRIGWVVGPAAKVEELWSYKDYTTIAPGALSDRLARVVLEPGRRERVVERTRSILRGQLPVVTEWVRRNADLVELIPPRAGGIAFVRYRVPVSSTALADRLRTEHGVLVAPGDAFGADGHVRVGFGGDADELREGLELLARLLGGGAGGARRFRIAGAAGPVSARPAGLPPRPARRTRRRGPLPRPRWESPDG